MESEIARYLAKPMREARHWLTIQPTLVGAHESVHQVARLAIQNLGARTISVIDELGTLIGVIPMIAIREQLLFEFAATVALSTKPMLLQARKIKRHLDARQAKDIMHPPASVLIDGTVSDALGQMQLYGLAGLPMTDAGDRVVGYVDQLELLAAPTHVEFEQ